MRMAFLLCLVVVSVGALTANVRADEVLYTYEGDVLPYAATGGWEVFNACDPLCSESLADGKFVLTFPSDPDIVYFHHWIAHPPTSLLPSTLWIEWRVFSNHEVGPLLAGCDCRFSIAFSCIGEVVYSYADSVQSHSLEDVITGLPVDQFHTFRFDSPDGYNYWIMVDGSPFIEDFRTCTPSGFSYIQFGGRGGCIDEERHTIVNQWDFIRYGTIGYGEAVVDSDPPIGDVSAMDYPDRTRFTVTFDSPNYVYVDDITVTVEDFSGVTPVAPINYPMVTQTRRLDNGPPEVVEIVLDKPIPHAATTTFTLTDGVATNIIAYTLSPADADGDGLATLADFAHFQNCFRPGAASSFCRTFDLNRDNFINLNDLTLAHPFLTNP